jgi:uncharacterized protein YbaP (TraB family)
VEKIYFLSKADVEKNIKSTKKAYLRSQNCLKMKHLTIVFFLFFFSISLFAQAPNANENSLLWKITGNGIKAPAYLYGTIHIIPRKDFFLTDSTVAALNQADNVAFEFNLKKEMRLIPQIRLMFQTRMKGDTTLDMLLSEEDYTFVKNAFKNKRVPMRFVERMKPMFISDLANQDFSASAKQSMTSYEMEFLSRAKAQDKKISGLETAKYQIGVFDKIPYSIQAQMLVEELRNTSDKSDKEYKRLVKIYKRQDLEMLAKMTLGDDDDLSNFNDILLDTRNRNWIPVMAKLMRHNKMFFAVGAAHLVGEKGVVSLLRKQGYILTAIK